MNREEQVGMDLESRRRLALLWSLSPRQIRRMAGLLSSGATSWTELARGRFPTGARIGERLRRSVAAEVRSWTCNSPAERMAGWESAGIKLCVRGESAFPLRLLQIPDPPSHLFYRGPYWCDGERLAGPRVGIIGSRAASPAGLEMARRFARDLALEGCVIVSGLARGIDGAAHRGALDAGGLSVAVLGTGPDRAYPRENADIFERLLSTGGVVSEFPPGTPPLPYHFPRRNRLLSGWVDLLIVIEGGERSGARSTVDHALDQGREVAAVPRDVLLEGAALPNRLLFDGARLVRSAEDVLSLLDSRPSRTVTDVTPWDGVGKKNKTGLQIEPVPANDLRGTILRLLGTGVTTSDAICAGIEGTPWVEIRTALTDLEIRGVVQRLPGDRLRRHREG